jgi:predicted RNase H-like HicB family nuclease
MELRARIHEDSDGSYWAEVKELPGCFASGSTLDELKEALAEAIIMCLEDGNGTEAKDPGNLTKALPPRLNEMTLVTQ